MRRDESLRRLLEEAARRGIDYREQSPSRDVAPTAEAVENVQQFIEPLPEEGTADLDVLAQLDDVGTPAAVAMTGPRFFGFVIGGSLPVTVASNWLTAAAYCLYAMRLP